MAAAILTLTTILLTPTCLRSPLVLYPLTPSPPEKPYLRAFGPIEIGKIAAFPMPETARRYQAGLGHDAPAGFLFMKPVVVGPGDLSATAFQTVWWSRGNGEVPPGT